MEYGVLECGCVATKDLDGMRIDYCPKHKAAPKLYEAIETALRNLVGRECSDIEFDLRQAIAEVEK